MVKDAGNGRGHMREHSRHFVYLIQSFQVKLRLL